MRKHNKNWRVSMVGVLLIGMFAVLSCKRKEPEPTGLELIENTPSKSTSKPQTSEPKAAPLVQTDLIDDSTKKVETTLIKGGVIVWNVPKPLSGKKYLDKVTVYRVLDDGCGCVKAWEVDNYFPQKDIDTTFIMLDGGTLKKLEYRQGYISAIYK